jgi:hypothetical protein
VIVYACGEVVSRYPPARSVFGRAGLATMPPALFSLATVNPIETMMHNRMAIFFIQRCWLVNKSKFRYGTNVYQITSPGNSSMPELSFWKYEMMNFPLRSVPYGRHCGEINNGYASGGICRSKDSFGGRRKEAVFS